MKMNNACDESMKIAMAKMLYYSRWSSLVLSIVKNKFILISRS